MEPKHTILIVDDEPVVRDAACRILADRGFALHAVGDAEAALDRMATTVPDVLLVDLMLPGLSGLALLDRVRVDHPGVVALVTTGYTSVEHALDALRRGAFDFLPKPFTFNELLGPVYRACRYLDLQAPAPRACSDAAEDGCVLLGVQAWARPEADGTALLGVTDVFVRTAGPLARADLPNVNGPVQQGGLLARFDAEDRLVHLAWAALTGRVLAVNPIWQTEPSRAVSLPADDGWIVRIAPAGGGMVNGERRM